MLEEDIRKELEEYNQKVVGFNQSKHMILEGQAELCIIAEDTDEPLKSQLFTLCEAHDIKVKRASSRDELARACDVNVKTAIVTLFDKR